MVQITDYLTQEEILDQMLEECSELIQAVNKLKRELKGRNKPHTTKDLAAMFNEELADVLLCASLVKEYEPMVIMTTVENKIDRWAGRLVEEAKDNGNR